MSRTRAFRQLLQINIFLALSYDRKSEWRKSHTLEILLNSYVGWRGNDARLKLWQGKTLLSMWNNWKKEKKTHIKYKYHFLTFTLCSFKHSIFLYPLLLLSSTVQGQSAGALLIQIFPTPTHFSDHVCVDLNIQRICCDGWKTNRNLQQQRSVIQIYQNTKHMLYWSRFSLSGKNSNNNIYTLEACSLQCNFFPHSFDS